MELISQYLKEQNLYLENLPLWLFTFVLLVILNGCTHHERPLYESNTKYDQINLINQWPWDDLPCLDDDQASKTAIENGILAVDDRGNAHPIELYVAVCGQTQKTIKLKIDSDTQQLTNHIKNSYNLCLDMNSKSPVTARDCQQSLLIFIHGGLNSYKSSLSRAVSDIPKMLCLKPSHMPNNPSDCYKHVLFVSWPSDGLETYRDSAKNYDQGEWDTPWAHKLWPFRTPTDIGTGVVRAPLDYIKSFRRFTEAMKLPTDDYGNDGKNGIYQNCDLNHQGFHCQRIIDDAGNIWDWQTSLYWTLGFPIRLASIPFIDPFGRSAWDNMVARARFTFRTPCEIRAPEIIGTEWKGTQGCRPGPVYKLFYELERLITQEIDREDKQIEQSFKNTKSDEVKLDITLIGHSMGTIVASDAISLFPTLPYKNIVFLGAAVSIREFLSSVQPMLIERFESSLSTTKGTASAKDIGLLDNIFTTLKDVAGQGTVSVSEAIKTVIDNEIKRLKNEKDNIWKNKKLSKATKIRNQAHINLTINNLNSYKAREFEGVETVLSNLQPQAFPHFYNVSLHPYAEAREINFAGIIPAGSLLQWIDDLYTTPADVFERTLGKWINVVSIDNMFDKGLIREGVLNFKRFDLSAKSPKKHGELADGEFERKHQIPYYWEKAYWL